MVKSPITPNLPLYRSFCVSSQLHILRPCNANRFSRAARPFTTTRSRHEDKIPANDAAPSGLTTLSRSMMLAQSGNLNMGFGPNGKQRSSFRYRPPPKPHHLHIFSTRHNTHITLTMGNRNSIISVSSGNLNFRKASRGGYDACWQLGAYVMARIKNMGLLDDRYPGPGGPITSLEVVFRDYGPGREAVTKVLLGQEGKELRPKITKVTDSTRLKFGGTRSPQPKRRG